MRILFAGTPRFSLPTLDVIADSTHELVAVYTQPDRRAGRGRKLQQGPIKQRALELGIPVEQPDSLKKDSALAHLRGYQPDLIVVIAYGMILPQAVLDLPALGCVNLHASLLPRWRGAAPIARALLDGDSKTGITLMQVDAGLDTGAILMQSKLDILPEDTAATLHDRLAVLSGQVMRDALPAIEVGDIRARPQPETGASYAHKLTKEEAHIDWQQPAEQVARAVRGFNPWPVASAELELERWRIWQARALTAAKTGNETPAGRILAATAEGIDVACGSGLLRITELQWPGGRRISASDACNGRDLVGKRFA